MQNKYRALASLVGLGDVRPDDVAVMFGCEFFVRLHPQPWITGVIERDLFRGLDPVSGAWRQNPLAA